MSARRPTDRGLCHRWLLVLSLGAIALLAPGLPASAQDLVIVRGEVGQTLSFTLEDGPVEAGSPLWTAGQVAVNRTHYRLEFERRFGYDAAGVIALKGRFDASAGVIEDMTGTTNGGPLPLIELDQAYVDLYSDSTDFRLGRQKIAWGTADGFNPTSYFAPLNLDLTVGGLGALVGPVTALRSATYFNVGTLSGVVVPTFERRRKDEVEKALKDGVRRVLGFPEEEVKGADEISDLPGNQGEIGVQFDTFYRGTSFYLSYFNGYEDQPAAWVSNSTDPEVATRWRRQHKLGLAVASVWRGLTLWGEATYTLPAPLEGVPPARALSPTEPYLQAVVGGDYLLPNGLRLELQYVYNGPGSLLELYQPADAPAGQYLMAMASCSLGENHSLEFLVLDSLNDDSAVWMPTYRYKLTPATEASLGVMLLSGSEGSEFARAGLTRGDRATLAVTVRF